MSTAQSTILVAGPTHRVQNFLSSVESRGLERGQHLTWSVLLSDARTLVLRIEIHAGSTAPRPSAARDMQSADGPQAFDLADLADTGLVVFNIERSQDTASPRARLEVLSDDKHLYMDDDLYLVQDERPDAARRLSLALALWEGAAYARHDVHVPADVPLN